MNSNIKKILAGHGYEGLINFLSKTLSDSELNSLLLEVYQYKSKNKKAAQILNDFSTNRFVLPSSIDPLKNMALELEMLKIVKSENFDLMELSPLTPFGTCSVHDTVNQNNIVSALRRVEVVSDLTNVLALEVAKRIKEDSKIGKIQLAAIHRLVRTQGFNDPKYTAHFKVLGMVTSSKDIGHFEFEHEAVLNHLKIYLRIFKEVYDLDLRQLKLNLTLMPEANEFDIELLRNKIVKRFKGLETDVSEMPTSDNNYYIAIRFSIKLKSMKFPIVDGGFVNWAAHLTQNRKQKMLISGLGTELMNKILAESIPQ